QLDREPGDLLTFGALRLERERAGGDRRRLIAAAVDRGAVVCAHLGGLPVGGVRVRVLGGADIAHRAITSIVVQLRLPQRLRSVHAAMNRSSVITTAIVRASPTSRAILSASGNPTNHSAGAES